MENLNMTEKLVMIQHNRRVIRLGWMCDFCSAIIGLDGDELWQVLPQFGQHNMECHGGTMQAHLVPVMEEIPTYRSYFLSPRG